jgi:steroid delta-isomerase-like uncharacterized protein
MSPEQNKAIMRRFAIASVVNDRASLEALLAPDFVSYQANGTANREEYLQHLSYYLTAFSDVSFTVDEQIAEGDQVVTRGTYSGTHSGDFQGLPPTGKQFAINAVLFDRIVDGEVVEHRSQFDMLSMMQQLGVVPPPQPSR